VAGCSGFLSGCSEVATPRVLLLITADTLRADELGAYGSTRRLTPRLDALAESGVVFASAYAPASLTLPSVAAMLTGRYPEELGIRSNESAVPTGIESVASDLSGKGWRTHAVVGNFVLRRSSGVAQGFEHFDDSLPRREPGVRAMPERTAEETTRAAVALLADCVEGAACFLWVHYQDPHGPYAPPAPWRERGRAAEAELPDSELELPLGRDHWGRSSIPAYQALGDRLDVGFYRAGYRGEIAYMDQQIGVLLDALSDLGLADAAVVAFAADHGESLGEGEVWFSHGTGLGDEQVRVPLMIRAPGLLPSRREQPVSLVDLRPTLVALATGAHGLDPGSGRDLLAEDPVPSAGAYMTNLGVGGTTRFALVDGDFKFVATERDGVFDGRLLRRGREDADLAAAAPHVASRLRSRLGRLRRRVATDAPETHQDLDESVRAELRALGYLTGPEEAELE
jgi:arylsulfatase